MRIIILALLMTSCALVDGADKIQDRETHQDKYDALHKDRKKRRQLRKKGYPTNPRRKGSGGYDKYAY